MSSFYSGGSCRCYISKFGYLAIGQQSIFLIIVNSAQHLDDESRTGRVQSH